MAKVKMNKETNFSKYREAFYNMVLGLKEILVSTNNIESDKDIEKQVAKVKKQEDNKRINEIRNFIEKENVPKSQQREIEKGNVPESQQRKIEKRLSDLSNPHIQIQTKGHVIDDIDEHTI